MFRKLRFSSICLTVIIIVLAGCDNKIGPGNSGHKASKAVKAAVGIARVSQQPFIYEAVGTVVPRTASTIASKLLATVRAVHVREGDRVKKGDILLELDQRQVDAEVDRAKAALAEALRAEASAESARNSAKAGADLAKSTYERYKKLLKENSVSRQEFDEVEARYRQAQAALAQAESMLSAAGNRVEQARAALENVMVSKKDTVVKAPYDGVITAKMVNVGDLASPGTPFFTLEKANVFCVDLVLPENHIQAVRLDQDVKVSIPALGDLELTGKIKRIVPAADTRSRSFLVKVALPENPNLRSGIFARVAIPVGDAGMILLPASALVRQGQLTGVFIVDKTQTAHFRLVRPGKHYGDSVEIISGISNGDRYVISPPPALHDGDKVEVHR